MIQRIASPLKFSAALLTALLGLPAAAQAEEQDTGVATTTSSLDSPEGSSKMDFSVAPPPPALQRTDFVHEGFYLRINAGPGILWSTVSDTTAGGGGVSGASFAFNADLLVGGSPSPGLTLGGAVLGQIGAGLNLKDDSGQSIGQGSHFHFIAGPFVDAFPNDKRGFHVGAALGFAGSKFNHGPNITETAWGGGAAAWLGYDTWVAPEWSVGAMLRGTGAYMVGDNADVTAFGLTLLLTLLYH